MFEVLKNIGEHQITLKDDLGITVLSEKEGKEILRRFKHQYLMNGVYTEKQFVRKIMELYNITAQDVSRIDSWFLYIVECAITRL